jgi:2-polyprenyl-3-methyl-5-hydroxy-6-metoxy-1,4-benzoquinol methylase
MGNTVFTDDQFQQLYPDGIENHYWNHARNAIILRFIKSSRLQNKHMLEIGSGRGVVIKYLHHKGISCAGVEQAAIEPLADIGDYFYAQTDAFDLPPEVRKMFSIVMLLDVIEHIRQPEYFIQKIIRAFPNVSNILMTVPARQELWTNYDQFNGHYKRYSLRDLKDLAVGNINYIKGGYFNHLLYPVFLFYAKFFGKRETTIMAPAGFQIAVHRIMSFILLSDYLLIPRKWVGTSAIALYSVNLRPNDG